MSFADSARHIRDNHSLMRYANQFGLSCVVTLLLIRRYVLDGKPHQEFHKIPNLVIRKNLPRQGSDADVETREDVFTLGAFSRAIAPDWIEATGVTFWVDADYFDGEIKGGWQAEYVGLDKNHPLGWILNLRRKPDERRLN